MFLVGLGLGLRYVYLALTGEGSGHVQSVILSSLLMGMGVFTGLIGIVADLISVNRKLLEKLLAQQRTSAHPSRFDAAPNETATKVSAVP